MLTLSEDVHELEDLARSAGMEIAFEVIQRRRRPEPSTFIGQGKLDELTEFLKHRRIDGILINGDLKPTQHYHLENTLKIECIDRLRLVLDIFTTRASSPESHLQVERAKLQYEIPLLREWIHSAKMGEHPGFLGGGEYAVDIYYDLIKKRMRKIDEELERLRVSGTIRRRRREKRGAHLVSLAGYTNAGKSSLFNALTEGDVLTDTALFSTLTTTTRKMKGSLDEILVTDTIGFFHDLPPFMIESFKSTLDELYSSDLILLVVDSSEDREEEKRKLAASASVLHNEVSGNRLIVVLNKIDLVEGREGSISEQEVESILEFSESVHVSAVTGEGIESLRMMIKSRFEHPHRIRLALPLTAESESLLSSLYQIGKIEEVKRGEAIEITLRLADKDFHRMRGPFERMNAVIEEL
ncbi:MAG TPA: GTPase HflX [Methanomassiliicoccales archaeon]|nr:GTPase HflX [Methanomassiliicoccales archaeon]